MIVLENITQKSKGTKFQSLITEAETAENLEMRTPCIREASISKRDDIFVRFPDIVVLEKRTASYMKHIEYGPYEKKTKKNL